jgi:hypothetical protein
LRPPEAIPAWRSFRKKNAGVSTVLFWNDTWVTDVMRRKIAEGKRISISIWRFNFQKKNEFGTHELRNWDRHLRCSLPVLLLWIYGRRRGVRRPLALFPTETKRGRAEGGYHDDGWFWNGNDVEGTERR